MYRNSTRWGWVFCGVLVLAVGLAGKEVSVTLKNGQEVSGELIDETANTITIRLEGGGQRKLPRDQIVGAIREKLSLAEQYRQKREKLKDEDIPGRLGVARWLHENKNSAEQKQAWTLATEELNSILKAKPDSQEAALMLQAVTTNLKKLEGAAPTPDGDTPKAGASPAPLGKPKPLTPEQINRMKVFELDLGSRPLVVVPPKVIADFLKTYTKDPVDAVMEPYVGPEGERAFKRLEPYEQLSLICEMKAREFYGKVQVRTEPPTLEQWRMNYHTQYVLGFCGSCHLAANRGAKGLEILRGPKGQENTAYTNLIYLSRREINGLPMISRMDPERSPLLQYGLPLDQAAIKHPEVQGFRPHFARGQDDPKFTEMVEWIRSLENDPRELIEGESGPAATDAAKAE